MTRQRRSAFPLALAALALTLATQLAPATHAAKRTARPTAAATRTPTATGSIRAAWTHERGSLIGDADGFRREVALRWKAVSVARTAAQAYAWLQGRQTRYTSYAIEFDSGYVIRATVAVERFTETTRRRCSDGSFAELTTTIAAVDKPQVLLKTSDTRLDLPRRRGTLDLRLPNDHVATGQQLPNDFIASGTVRLANAGTVCGESGGARPPGPSDVFDEQELAYLLGSTSLNGIVQDNPDLPVTVARDGTLAVSVNRTREVTTGLDEGERIAGTYAADLKLTGPTTDRSARCTLPSAAQMRGARSLTAAQVLLRRHGFPRAPLGRPRAARTNERGGLFALNAPVRATAPCGSILGTARQPVLVPLRG